MKDSNKAKQYLQKAINIASDIYELGAEIGLDKEHRGEDLYYIEDHLKKINDAARGEETNEGELDERVAGLDQFIALIKDRAGDSDFSEKAEAAEVIENLMMHYELEPSDISGNTNEEIISESELDKVLKAMELVKQQAPAMNKLDRNDPKRIAFIEKVKKLNIKKKELMDKEDDRISNIGKGQELDVDEDADLYETKNNEKKQA